LPMIPYTLDLTVEKLKGPTKEQLITGNQWAVTALNRFHAGDSANIEFDIDGVRYSSRIIWKSNFSPAAMRERTDLANHGGVAIAMFVMSVLLNYEYVEQTEIGEGVDFKFMEKEPPDDEWNFMRGGHFVEVSGMLEESPSNTLAGRIKMKQAQISRGSRNSEQASAIVTLFSQPKTVKEVHR
jgi:hypothetical protein